MNAVALYLKISMQFNHAVKLVSFMAFLFQPDAFDGIKGFDAIKAFDCCSLTLQPTKRPVISPQGYVFDKEAIFNFILEKKKTYEKQMKEFERQKQEEMKEFRDKAAQEEEEARERFEATEKNIVTKRVSSNSSDESGSVPTGVSNMSGSRKRELPSFWLPSMCPDAKKSKLVKPDKTVYCPMSGKPLKGRPPKKREQLRDFEHKGR